MLQIAEGGGTLALKVREPRADAVEWPDHDTGGGKRQHDRGEIIVEHGALTRGVALGPWAGCPQWDWG